MTNKLIRGICSCFYRNRGRNSCKNGFDGTYARKGKVKVIIDSFSKPKDKNYTFIGYRITNTEYTRFTIERPHGTNVKQAKEYVKNGYSIKKRRKR